MQNPKNNRSRVVTGIQFIVTPKYGEPVTATIAEEWSQPGPLILSNGDKLSRLLVRKHIDSCGLTPDGRAVDSEYLAPKDLHYTFESSDKFEVQQVDLEGAGNVPDGLEQLLHSRRSKLAEMKTILEECRLL